MATKKFCDVCDREIKTQVDPARVDLRFQKPGSHNYSSGTIVKLMVNASSNGYGALDLCLRCVIKEMQKQLQEHDPQPKGDRVYVRDEEER